MNGKTGVTNIAFQKTYGMCFAGSFAGAYAVREFLFIILQRLQFVPKWVEVSFVQICKVVNKFYGHLAQKIKDDLNYDHSIDFFFAGYCPKDKKLKIAKFFIEHGENFENYNPKYKVFPHNDFIESIGVGEDKFKEYLKDFEREINPDFRILKAIKKTVDEGGIESVGGNIQYGSFNIQKEFTTFGIEDQKYDEKGFLGVRYCIAGININGDEFEPKDAELHIMGSFIAPFKKPS